MKEYFLRKGNIEIWSKKKKVSVYAVLDNYKYWFDPPGATEAYAVLNRKPLVGYRKFKKYKERLFNKKELDKMLPFLKKSIILLPYIENGDSCIKIYKKLKGYVNYTHLQIALSKLEKIGLIKIRIDGREAKSYLTERGNAAKQLVRELIEVFQKPKD